MNRTKFKFDPSRNTPIDIELNALEKESHGLIHLLKEKNCKSLNLGLIAMEKTSTRRITAKTYHQLDLVGCDVVSVEASFVTEIDAYAEGEFYTGTWEEMVLVETELSFTASPFYISCSQEEIEFTIGAPGESRMEIRQNEDGDFTIVTTLLAGGQESGSQQVILDRTEASQVIRRLYGRIRGRVNGKGFEQRREEYKLAYAENFNKTLLEGFHTA